MRILIAGAGKLGYKLAEAFSNQENSITVIDINEQALQRVHTNLDVLAVKGSAVQVELLQQASVKNADLFAAVTSSDEVNIVAAQLAKKLGCRQAAARVRNPEYAKQLDFLRTEMDIDYIVNPELETARYIAKYLLKGTLVYVESFADGRVGMLDFPVKNIPEWVGKKLREIGSFDAVLVAAVAREGEMIIPHGETSLMDRHCLFVRQAGCSAALCRVPFPAQGQTDGQISDDPGRRQVWILFGQQAAAERSCGENHRERRSPMPISG